MRRAALVASTRDLADAINAAHVSACRAASSAIDHARRAGALLLEAKGRLQHGEWLPWLTAHCPELSARVAQGYMRIADQWTQLAAANTKRDSHLPIRDALKLLTPPREAYNSGEYQWYSPPEYLEAARTVMGGIDLDPASSAAANVVVQADQYYDLDHDGLQQPWHGRVWLNPPYTNALMTAFAARLIEHYARGDVTDAIVLTNNATDTGWFHDLASRATAICFPRGRAHYWRADTQETSSALQGQSIFYFGARLDQFMVVFGAWGLIFWGDPPCPTLKRRLSRRACGAAKRPRGVNVQGKKRDKTGRRRREHVPAHALPVNPADSPQPNPSRKSCSAAI